MTYEAALLVALLGSMAWDAIVLLAALKDEIDHTLDLFKD